MYNIPAPTGYRFKPSDVVLIQHYLIPKVEGRPLPSEHIFETGVIYGEEAPDLEFTFGQAKEWYKQFASYDENFDDSLYFYTKLTKKWEKGSRISRSAGSGTWTGDKGEVIYTDQTYNVKRSYYTYTDNAAKSEGPKGKVQKRKKTTLTSDGNTCTWSMHEYSILKGEQPLDYAIVKITRKPSKKSLTSKQFQLPVGQCYVNTSYHTGAGGVDFQHLQGSSISSGNVVPVLPAAEYNHLQHQPSTSYSSTELDAAGFPDFSFPRFLQDAMLQPPQLNFQSYSDSLYNKHLLPSAYQHKTAVPPLITDHQEENNLDSAVEPVAADDSRAIGADNAAASDRDEYSCNYEVINEAVACQDGFKVPNTAIEGQHYANTSYHPALHNGVRSEYFQNSSSSLGNVVPAAEYNYTQYQPYASTSSSNNTGLPGFWLNNCVFNEQSAALRGFSSPSVLQDDVIATQQQLQAWSDPMYKNIPNYQGPPFVSDTCYQYPLPPGCKQVTENNMDLSANSFEAAVEPVAVAVGGDNADVQDHNQEGTTNSNGTLIAGSEVEAVQPQNNLSQVSDEEFISYLSNASEENLMKLKAILFPDNGGSF